MLKISAYVVTFAVGMWGGTQLIHYLQDNSEGNQVAQAMVKQAAPAFSLPDLHGAVHNSSEWQGKVLAINFWATWCPPCVKETPGFVELQKQYGAQGLQFVGIAIDSKDKVQDFMTTYGVNYPMLIGEDKAIQVAKDYGNRFGALPYTVIIDRQGTIQLVQRGELTREMAEHTIQRLL
jgi:peroxiredoxin